ncbi:hypothetical protein ACIGNX_18630 [Actinosynnema sp. NPDC053489]|uniref:hypothetical protein n=1 Tax=Actinosynnema sp. NPDC053489 TaxID=3363916 RepID=UPI0037C51D94
MDVHTIETAAPGDRGYPVHDDGEIPVGAVAVTAVAAPDHPLASVVGHDGRRGAFAAGHLVGTVGCGPGFTAQPLPRGEPVALVGSEEDVRAAIRDRSRTGVDRPSAPIGDPADDPAPGHPVVLLDVRRPDEPRAGIAASLPHGAGRDVVRLDDDRAAAADAGVPTTAP